MNKDNFIYSAVFIFILTFILASALAWIQDSTKSAVALNSQADLARATLSALQLEQTDNPVAAFTDAIGKTPAEMEKIEQVTLDGQLVKVMQFSGMGLWDRISGIITVNQDVSKIIGVSITEQKETPGLGGRITEPKFLLQFSGKKIAKKTTLKSSGNDSYFDAISGATLTSIAFNTIINDSINQLRNN